jgi:light-regulated signal transduction histidine kinase (bacteriophytochrome)
MSEPLDPALLARELAREKAARRAAEDLLEQKSLELYQRNVDLEREIATRRDTEAALRDHAEALQRSNADLEQFAAVASHDLQAPLRTISGFSQLLVRRNAAVLDAESQEFLRFIDEGAQHLHALIRDLLAFSRVSRSALAPTPVSLQAIVEQVVDTLRLSLEAAGAQVIAEGLPEVLADRTQMSLLFQNLIDNGVKFRRPDVPPRVEVRAARDGEQWHLVVEDNGIGIPPEHAERVFTIFQRLHRETEYAGTGIGLPICRKIVERRGGSIEARPAEGHPGTAFHIRIPVVPPV